MKYTKRINPVLLWFLAATLILGCTKETDWPVSGVDPNRIVVDALLTDQPGTQQVRLTHPVDGLNTNPLPITGATMILATADSLWFLQEEPAGSGMYNTDSNFYAQINQTYTLQVIVDNRTYSAQATMAPPRLFNELITSKNDADSLYHIAWVASAFNADYPAMWEILIDWSFLPACQGMDPDECHARLLFYTLSTLDVSEIFAPAMEQVSFPRGSLITERRYSLSSDHERFVRELLLETNWQGSMFPTANANVYTNLSNGAIGFFGLCGMTELSLIVDE
jgi:hypothetical protein